MLINVCSILDFLFTVCGPKGFSTAREKRNDHDCILMHFSQKWYLQFIINRLFPVNIAMCLILSKYCYATQQWLRFCKEYSLISESLIKILFFSLFLPLFLPVLTEIEANIYKKVCRYTRYMFVSIWFTVKIYYVHIEIFPCGIIQSLCLHLCYPFVKSYGKNTCIYEYKKDQILCHISMAWKDLQKASVVQNNTRNNWVLLRKTYFLNKASKPSWFVIKS